MLIPIVHDEAAVEQFATTVLPDLAPDECFFVLLCARKKYLQPDEKSVVALNDMAGLRREIVKDKSRLVRKLKELSFEPGWYTDLNGKPIPDHALAVYITSNPRSYTQAAVKTVTEIAEGLAAGKPLRLESMVKTLIHRSISRSIFMDLDIDPAGNDDLPALINEVRATLGQSRHHVVLTKSGAHVLLQTEALDPAVKPTFYRDLQTIGKRMEGLLEIRKDAMVPIPGALQGGAIPRLLAE